jgi:hypothetical protein
MMQKREEVELAYLYFIPKPQSEFQSFFYCSIIYSLLTGKNTIKTNCLINEHTLTLTPSKFLDKIIRPIFDKHARSTTIIDGVDLIRRLEKYHTNGYLKPTTLLCTSDFTDLYTMLPKEESFNVLMEFLSHHGYQKVMSVPIDLMNFQ